VLRNREGRRRGEFRSPDFGKGKERESKKEGASPLGCLGADYDWLVYRVSAAKGRFFLAAHGCPSFGRTRNGTGACPRLGPDLPTRRRHNPSRLLSWLCSIRSFQVFCGPVGSIYVVIHAVCANGLMIPMARIETHHITQALHVSCPWHQEGRSRPPGLISHLSFSRDGCRIGGPSDAGTRLQRAITTTNIWPSETCLGANSLSTYRHPAMTPCSSPGV
jgi:hypothetical protein